MKTNPTSLSINVEHRTDSSVLATAGATVTAHTDLKPENLIFNDQYIGGRISGVYLSPATLSGADSDKIKAFPPQASRAYPHIYDDAAAGSLAMSLIANAQLETRNAIDYFGDGDLQSVSASFSSIALMLAAAHEHTGFNDSFGALLSYLRRGILVLSLADVQLSQLMSIAKALDVLHEQPMMTLDQASDEVEALETAGVFGEHQAVELLVRTLLESSNSQLPQEYQQSLFEGVR